MPETKKEDGKSDLRKELNEIYTPLSVAKKEIWKRWNDKALKKKVESFLKNDVPCCMKKTPKAVLVRHIVSPNYEFCFFIDLIKQAGLDYRCIEFPGDKLVAKNRDKYYLCKMYLYHGLGKHMGEKTNCYNIVDINEHEGKTFHDIKTAQGEKIVNFHHRLLHSIFPKVKNKIYDISPWFFGKGPSSEEFYLYYLALFVRNGILFENFSFKEKMEENEFCKGIVVPAIKKIIQVFGVKPLIVPILPIESESEYHWWHYPVEVEKYIDRRKRR